jgi:cytochrome c
METITIKAYTTDSSQINAMKAFMKALKIKFEISKDKHYNPSFVDMVLDAEKDIKANKGTKVSSKEFDNLWK